MRLRHARQHLELHQLSDRSGRSLLLLHELFGSSEDWQAVSDAWPGPVYALDFPGHGRSDWLAGGAYWPEYFAASVDIALQQIGAAAIAGAGFGAYMALLIAGGRPDLVPAALLLPGAGLAGIGSDPDLSRPLPDFAALTSRASPGSDPLVAGVELYWRPTEYVEMLAASAHCLLLAEDDNPRPPWWEQARKSRAARSVEGMLADMLFELRTQADEA